MNLVALFCCTSDWLIRFLLSLILHVRIWEALWILKTATKQPINLNEDISLNWFLEKDWAHKNHRQNYKQFYLFVV